MRRPHWLRSQETASYPHDLVSLDTETREHRLDESTVEHRLVFGWAAHSEYTSRETWTDPAWHRFTAAVECWQWLESRCRSKRALWVYCHNANFDWQVLDMFTLLPELGWTADPIILGDPPNYVRWKKGDRTLKMLDTTNYWKMTLKKLGEKVGLEKYDLPPDWHDVEASDRYCRRDVEIVLAAVQQWIAYLKEHDFGGLSISLAQQAWRAYTHRFMTHPIYIDNNVEALALSRSAYYGGRTEAWTVGTFVHDVTCLDVNSMYPYVMRTYEYPTRLHGRYSRISRDELIKWVDRYAITANCTLRTDRPFYPLRSDRGLLFPIGTFTTVLSTPEISAALEADELVECHAACIYSKAPIFQTYIDEMYALRQQYIIAKDEAGKTFTKDLQNHLYGKFGQRAGNEVIVGDCDPKLFRVETEIDAETGKRYRWRYIGGRILLREDSGESRESHPAIAAHVTAYARCRLWYLAETAGIENVHYMDTDSLHVSQEGRRRLAAYCDPSQLGALKVEKEIDTAVYYGPKDYELDGKRVIKGVRSNATELDVGVFSQSQWVSLKGATVAEHRGAPLVRQIEKRFTRQYKKGTVQSNNRVSPLRLTLQEIVRRMRENSGL